MDAGLQDAVGFGNPGIRELLGGESCLHGFANFDIGTLDTPSAYSPYWR
jgi:hypothetical protein